MEEVKKYLIENLAINLHYEGDNKLVVDLLLEGEPIAKSYVHYKLNK